MLIVTRSFLCLLTGLIVIGCAPETMSESDMANADCDGEHTLCVDLMVPDSYTGEAGRLVTAMYDSSDTNRPPQGIMPEILEPSIVPGEMYRLTHTDVDSSGEYYLMFVLYDVDGGQWIPEAGIDYIAVTPQSVVFDGAPVHLGEMMFDFAD